MYAQGPTSTADLAEGKRLFAGRCATCHGQSGEGGRGPVMRPGRSDRELFGIIRAGIPDSEMPALAAQTDQEIGKLVAFVQELSKEAGANEVFRGDPGPGKDVYDRESCGVCHRIDGQGNNVGPDLSRAGSHSARFLKQSIVDPNADVPLSYRAVSLTTSAGQTIRGI